MIVEINHACILIYESRNNGEMFTRRYIGYTKKEAIKEFKIDLNKENPK